MISSFMWRKFPQEFIYFQNQFMKISVTLVFWLETGTLQLIKNDGGANRF